MPDTDILISEMFIDNVDGYEEEVSNTSEKEKTEFIYKKFELMRIIEPEFGIPLNAQVDLALTLTKFKSNVPILSPVIIPSRNLLYGGGTAACCFFPSNFNVSDYRKRIDGRSDMFKVVDSRGLFTGHKIMDVEKFDFGKLERVRDYVKQVGALTFRMFNLKGMYDYLMRLGRWCGVFKYSCITQQPDYGRKYPASSRLSNDRLAMYITLMDLPLAIPIYKTKSVDGIAMTVGLYWPESSNEVSSLFISKELHLIVSNFEENIFCVDGVTINSSSDISRIGSRLPVVALKRALEFEEDRINKGLTKEKESAADLPF